MIPIDKARVPIARNEAALALFTTDSNAIRCAKAESFMKTMKVETVCPMTFENFDDVIDYRPRFIEDVYKKKQAPFGARISEPAAVRGSKHLADWQISSLISVHPQGALHRGALEAI